MTSIAQSSELPLFFPFCPYKWRNEISEYNMRTGRGAHFWTEKAERKGCTLWFMAEEFLADEKDCNKILTFLTS